MIISFFRRVGDLIINKLPFYNLSPRFHIQDQNRGKRDLINDLIQKRILVNKLNKRFRLSFMYSAIVSLLFFGYVIIDSNAVMGPERKVFNSYVSDFSIRLNSMNSNEQSVEDAEILVALSFIKDGDYKQASMLLSALKCERASWLRALCCIRMGEDQVAMKALREIIDSKGEFSLSAKQVLNKYYQQDY